jgi:hypothetical protein
MKENLALGKIDATQGLNVKFTAGLQKDHKGCIHVMTAKSDPDTAPVLRAWCGDPNLGMWDSEICSRLPGVSNHLIPTTIESGPQRGSTRVSLNPASRIQPLQSAPVKSKPTSFSISMFRLMSKPNVFCRR